MRQWRPRRRPLSDNVIGGVRLPLSNVDFGHRTTSFRLPRERLPEDSVARDRPSLSSFSWRRPRQTQERIEHFVIVRFFAVAFCAWQSPFQWRNRERHAFLWPRSQRRLWTQSLVSKAHKSLLWTVTKADVGVVERGRHSLARTTLAFRRVLLKFRE